jgi:demethylmenaquinone methyltransferase/2-methoxy-6-polyprenyl-1,4-benzoquinol methylase
MDAGLNRAGHIWRPLQKMFTEVPGRYDLMNRLLTFRLDERWRKKAAVICVSGSSGKIIDLCTGTGDLALHMARRLKKTGAVIAVDYSRPMLDIARSKYLKSGLRNISFLEADAAALPFEDCSVDVIGIAFAFRNLTYKNPDCHRFMAEILRILNETGRFVILETSQPELPVLKWLFHLYLEIVVSSLGGWLSGHKTAYRYLSLSAKKFYTPLEMKQLLLSSGFSSVSHNPLMGGIAAITIATKK